MTSRHPSGSILVAIAATALLCLVVGFAHADDGRGGGDAPPGPGISGPGPGPGPAGSPPPGPPPGHFPGGAHGNATDADHRESSGGSWSRVFKPSDVQGGSERRRSGLLTHDDALNARNAGQIISLKQAIDATHSPHSTVIEVKLFGYANRAVYRIKLMDQDGTIRTVRINAMTAEPAGLF